MAGDIEAGATMPAPKLSAGYTRYALGLLMLIYVLNMLDRQVLTILAESIKRDLDLADWQIGAMSGLAFAVLYCFLGIPIARLAERANRPLIIASAVAIWSGFTVLCGLSQNFLQLVLSRIGVGVGEAGCSPPAISLISDYVPPEKRSSAIALYLAGGPLGVLLGMAIGGVVADHYGWRMAFFIVGAPGLLVGAIAALTLIEPRRRAKISEASAPVAATHHAFLPTLRILWSKRTYRLVVIAVTVKAFIQYGTSTFLASFFFRNHAVELASAAQSFGLKTAGFLGIVLGVTTGVTGVVGSILGGYLADRFAKRDIRNQARMPAIAILVSTPIYLSALFMDSLVGAMAMLIVPGILNALYYGPAYSIVQGLVEPNMRATATAIMLFILNLLALGLGPLAIGILSDVLSGPMGMGDAAGIQWSLAVFILLGFPSSLLFYAAGTTLREETVS